MTATVLQHAIVMLGLYPSFQIKLLARLHHCHLVPLLGYCLERQGKNAEMLVVFEYIPNGNVRDCLDGDIGQCLDWNTRVSIALGAARGSEYLHDAAAPRILHRDVKSTNILLDEKWSAKITDLGMAKHIQNDGIASCSRSNARDFWLLCARVCYYRTSFFNVFSFCVVLLELITGRKPIHKTSNKGAESLVIWVPKQPDGFQCGYYVMKYLSEIIEFDGLETITSLQSLFNKNSYSTQELGEVRTEWADCVQDYMYA